MLVILLVSCFKLWRWCHQLNVKIKHVWDELQPEIICHDDSSLCVINHQATKNAFHSPWLSVLAGISPEQQRRHGLLRVRPLPVPEGNPVEQHITCSVSVLGDSHSCKTVLFFLLQGRVATLPAIQWQLCNVILSDLSWSLTTDVYFLFLPDSHQALNKHSPAFISAFIISLVYHGTQGQLLKWWV